MLRLNIGSGMLRLSSCMLRLGLRLSIGSCVLRLRLRLRLSFRGSGGYLKFNIDIHHLTSTLTLNVSPCQGGSVSFRVKADPCRSV